MNSRWPPLTVVLPAYNHERYVEAALESVRLEGYPNLAIAAIDDGSTDGTWDRMQAWEGANRGIMPIVIQRQENLGLTRTMNRLLNLASGTYVAMLASDDRLLPGGLAARVSFLEQHPELTAVFADCRVIDADGDVVAEHGIAFGNPNARRRLVEDTAGEIVMNWGVPGPVIVYRREAIRALGGYDDTLLLEDWDLYLRLASRGQIAYLDAVVSEYRWHGENTVARPEQAIRLSDELRTVAWRSRRLFRGRLYLELVHESASWAARAEWLRRRPLRWLAWKAVSVALKLGAKAVPRRKTDQVGLHQPDT